MKERGMMSDEREWSF